MTTPSPTWELSSPAKLNLMLHIVGRRQDGYHELQTVFQILDYGDTLHITPNNTGLIQLETPFEGVPPEDNLIVRAARLLQQTTTCKKGASIGVTKLLPMGGGLGGGSSNAATTLVGLNRLWQTGLSTEALCQLGLSLGADVPVFVQGHSAWAEGVGERLSPLALKSQWFVVIFPQVMVNTGRIFSHPDLTRNTPFTTIRTALDGDGHNDCERVVRQEYPAVNQALNWLNRHVAAKLTGTGSCIYGALNSREAAERILKLMPNTFTGFVAQGVNDSPLHRQISKITTTQ